MSDLRKAAEMAIDAMMSNDVHKLAVAIVELRQALAQPEQEPVAWMKPSGLISPYKHGSYTIPLYTAPPKREWVGLTDEERERATGWSVEHIESYLKDKNT